MSAAKARKSTKAESVTGTAAHVVSPCESAGDSRLVDEALRQQKVINQRLAEISSRLETVVAFVEESVGLRPPAAHRKSRNLHPPAGACQGQVINLMDALKRSLVSHKVTR
jgi:hypothetical protein